MLTFVQLTQGDTDRGVMDLLQRGLQLVRGRLQQGAAVLEMVPLRHPFVLGDLGHMHAYPELIITCCGRGRLDLVDASFPLLPERMVVTPRGVAHLEFPEDQRRVYANLIVGCSPERLTSHIRITRPGQEQGSIRRRIVIEDARLHRCTRYLNEACSAQGEVAGAPGPMPQGLCLAATALLEEVVTDALAGDAGSGHEHLVSLAKAYVEQHLTNPRLRVSGIARELGCNADYLSHRFHAVSGTALSRWIGEQRLGLACALLRDLALGVEEVGRTCGFRDPAYFSRCFRAAYGLSPRAWRKSQG